MTEQKHLIWSNYNLDYEDWRTDLEKQHYNPFVYLLNDIQRLVTNLFKGSQDQDPFGDQAAQMLLLARVFYLQYETPPDEWNFPIVMEMIRAEEIRKDDEDLHSPLDELVERLKMRKQEHIALKLPLLPLWQRQDLEIHSNHVDIPG